MIHLVLCVANFVMASIAHYNGNAAGVAYSGIVFLFCWINFLRHCDRKN